MAADDMLTDLQRAAVALEETGVALAPCGEVLAGEPCCGRTAEEVAAEVAAYEKFRSQTAVTSPEAAR
jgi:hypothetical protein